MHHNGYGNFAQAIATTGRGRTSFGQVGPEGAVEWFVSMLDINRHAEVMNALNTDVLNFVMPVTDCHEETIECAKRKVDNFHLVRSYTAFKWKWTAFYLQWDEWVTNHYSQFSRLGQEPVQEFEAYQRNYNELRREYLDSFGKLGAKTDTEHIEPGTPGGSELVKKVSGTISTVAMAVIVVAGVLALQSAERAGLLPKGRGKVRA